MIWPCELDGRCAFLRGRDEFPWSHNSNMETTCTFDMTLNLWTCPSTGVPSRPRRTEGRYVLFASIDGVSSARLGQRLAFQ